MAKRTTKVNYKGTVERRGEASNLMSDPGDFVIVKRGVPRVLVLRCPCGCGDELVINLDKRSGPAWRVFLKSEKYTLYPSYWREGECGSHFIVSNNQVHWFDRSNSSEYDRSVDEEVENRVAEVLTKEPTHYLQIAEQCDLTPWECHQACMQLVDKGLCITNEGLQKNYFHKSASNTVY